jgi:hypothetical protein
VDHGSYLDAEATAMLKASNRQTFARLSVEPTWAMKGGRSSRMIAREVTGMHADTPRDT